MTGIALVIKPKSFLGNLALPTHDYIQTRSGLSNCSSLLDTVHIVGLSTRLVACLDRSQGSIGVAVTCLATQRVIYLKIKVKGLTAVTVFAYHVIFAPAVGLRKAEQSVKIRLRLQSPHFTGEF